MHVPSPTVFPPCTSLASKRTVTPQQPPPQQKSSSQPPNPGRINFPKRHSAGSLGKLEEAWKRGKGKGMRPGRELMRARTAPCKAIKCQVSAFPEAIIPNPLLIFRYSRFFGGVGGADNEDKRKLKAGVGKGMHGDGQKGGNERKDRGRPGRGASSRPPGRGREEQPPGSPVYT